MSRLSRLSRLGKFKFGGSGNPVALLWEIHYNTEWVDLVYDSYATAVLGKIPPAVRWLYALPNLNSVS
uniref:Uncharacterized protein n=1 Tax=viral metagenome TaxID=1070528 RepID=A0A6M3KV05_9ZZZZ